MQNSGPRLTQSFSFINILLVHWRLWSLSSTGFDITHVVLIPQWLSHIENQSSLGRSAFFGNVM